MSNEEQSKKMGQLIAKCWADESFKQRLLADANATLKAEGVEIPAGVTVIVVENTGSVINYVLPKNPKAELSDADLDTVAGAGCSIDGPGIAPLPGVPRCQCWIDFSS